MNSVHQITTAPRARPDAAHAIVVIGIGLDATWPYTAFDLILDEYSVPRQSSTGNCFHYNRIEAIVPSTPANITYLAYEVPANAYVYSARNVNANLAPSSTGHAFVAPGGAVVYFGDYVFVGNKTVEFRRDVDAARSGARWLLPRDTVLEVAAPTNDTHARPLQLIH